MSRIIDCPREMHRIRGHGSSDISRRSKARFVVGIRGHVRKTKYICISNNQSRLGEGVSSSASNPARPGLSSQQSQSWSSTQHNNPSPVLHPYPSRPAGPSTRSRRRRPRPPGHPRRWRCTGRSRWRGSASSSGGPCRRIRWGVNQNILVDIPMLHCTTLSPLSGEIGGGGGESNCITLT